jgi:hypothetical protein
MEVTGKVIVIGDVQTFGSGFRKRELVIETNEQYPQFLNIEFIQDNVNLLDSVQLESNITVHINLRGRKWTDPQGVDKYFNSIVGWRISTPQAAGTNVPPQQPAPGAPMGSAPSSNDEESDLPF